MSPPLRSTLAAAGGHPNPGEALAKMAANPNTITAIASRLRDSSTTIAATASTIVSLISLTIGGPADARRAAKKPDRVREPVERSDHDLGTDLSLH